MGNPKGRLIRWMIFLPYSLIAYIILVLPISNLSFSFVISFFLINTVVWATLFFPWMRGGVTGHAPMHLRNLDIKNRWAAFFEDFVFFPIGIFGFPVLDFYAGYRAGTGFPILPLLAGGVVLFGGLMVILYKMLSASIAGAASIPTDNLPPSLLP